jgi:hypothetical protein
MISSNPYHPLRPTAGITHTWMGESWMVDGETSVMMMVMISSKSPSRHGARMEFLVPNRGFWWWRHSGSLCGKNAEPPMLSGERVYVGGRRGRGEGWDGHTTPWCGMAWPAPLGGVSPSWPLFISSSGKIGVLWYFLGFFLWKLDFCTKMRHQSNSAKNSVSSH